jgi:beta-glucosidase-like glycosyl hydrolase
VLLKNGKNQKEPFLPLAKNVKRILVAGTHADNIGYQCGGWTIAWGGESGRITLGKQKKNSTRQEYMISSYRKIYALFFRFHASMMHKNVTLLFRNRSLR